METLPIDVTAIVATVFGLSIFLIPVAGWTLRFALKPFAEAMAVMRGSRRNDDELRLLEKRVDLLERQLEAVTSQRLLPSTTANVGTPMPNGTVKVTPEN